MCETLGDAVDALAERDANCLIIGPDVPESDLEGFAERWLGSDVWREMALLVYGRPQLDPEAEAALKRLAKDVTVRFATSPERLLDQTSLLLHRLVATMPGHQRDILQELHHSNRALAGRKVLIVDDDIRNIFALTSILERHEMTIVSAETGRNAIELLDKSGDIDVVLMDVMMPEMDGYETTRAIRQRPHFRNLPIIAVTAKAMKGDREKCIEAGAWDYLSKPVDPEELMSMLRAWLFR